MPSSAELDCDPSLLVNLGVESYTVKLTDQLLTLCGLVAESLNEMPSGSNIPIRVSLGNSDEL